MNIQIGIIYRTKDNKVSILIVFHYYSFKYKKIQVKVKKYSILNYKNEYSSGDIVIFNLKNNKIYNLF